MANIQAALNNMLSSAQAGAFIYTQTPEYKKRGEIKELQKEEGILTKEDEDLNTEIENPKEGYVGSNRLVSVYERNKDLDKELYENQLALYKQTGDKKYLEESFKYSPSQRKDWDYLIEEEKKRRSELAGKSAVSNVSTKADTHRNQSNELKVRLDLLSAKERGQLTTMYNRQQKKMTKEEQ